MEFKETLLKNPALVEMLRSPQLQQQLRQVLDKQKEKELLAMFNDYYNQGKPGGPAGPAGSAGAGGAGSAGRPVGNSFPAAEESLLKDFVLDSAEFKEFILELISTLADQPQTSE